MASTLDADRTARPPSGRGQRLRPRSSATGRAAAAEQPRRDRARAAARPRDPSCENLNFYYGKYQALKGISLDDPPATGDRVHRPLRLRQVDAAADLQPHVRALSGPAGRRARSCSTASNVLDAGTRPEPAARARSAWCSRSPPRSRCRSTTTSPSACGSTSACARRDGRARGVGAAQGGAVGRGQGQAEADRHAACRAASSSGCASRARSPSSPRCCCSTSRPRRSTRSRPLRSRS